MMIYLPVKFEFDLTNHFRVRVRKPKCGRTDRQMDVGHINLLGSLVTRNPPKNVRHALCQDILEYLVSIRDCLKSSLFK